MTLDPYRVVVLAPLALDESTDWPAALASAAAMTEPAPDLLVLGDGPLGHQTHTRGRVWRASVPAGRSTGQLAAHAVEALAQIQAEAPDRALLVVAPMGPGEALAAAIAALADYQPLGRCQALRLGADGLSVVKVRGRLRLDISCQRSATVSLQPVASQAPADASLNPDEREELSLILTTATAAEDPIRRRPLAGQGVNLEGAALVVSGGRGLGEDGFALLDMIAEQLGAGMGASLAAVDQGLAPVSRQIGQSGKFVTPEIYLAVGLSGTPQHMAGVGLASRILAINNDPDAAIFECAELGMVADWREALPALLLALGERK